MNRVIRYEYDALGNLTAKREGIEERFLKPDGKKRTVWAVTRYEYDLNGNCVRMVTPKGYEREWQYDALERVVTTKEQDKVGGICKRNREKRPRESIAMIRKLPGECFFSGSVRGDRKTVPI